MTEKENFDDLIRQKLSEEEFPFDEKNWEKAASMIDASRGSTKKPFGYIALAALLVISLCVVIPVIYYNNNDNNIAENNTTVQTNSNSSENSNSKSEITNNNLPTSVATNFDNQDAKPNSETSNTSITSNENTSTNSNANAITKNETANEAVTKQEPRSPKRETQGNTNSNPAADASKINTTAKTQSAKSQVNKSNTAKTNVTVNGSNSGNTKPTVSKTKTIVKTKGTDVTSNGSSKNTNAARTGNKKSGADKAAEAKAKADRIAAEKAEADKIALDKANAEKAAADKAIADKKAAEEKAIADKKAADEKAIAEKLAAEKLAADKAAEEKAAAEKLAADKAAKEKAAAEKLAADKAAQDKANAEKTKTPPSKNVLWVEAGGDYLLGWDNGGKKDANGLNIIGGLNFTHLFTNKIGVSIGAQYNSISNIKGCIYSAQRTTYEFGDVRDITNVSTQKLHYLVAPIKFHFVINNNNTIGAGVNIAYLINSKSSVETYTQKLNTQSNRKVETSPGYYNGFASPDVQLSVFYKRRIYKGLGVNTEFIYGLSDVKNDAFFNSAEAKQRTMGFKLTLTYDLISK